MSTGRPPRLPSVRFSGLLAQDIEGAIARFDAGEIHNFGDSTRYDLVYRGMRYPPKAIFGLATERIVGRKLKPADFAGGLGSICFRALARLGYSVIAKTAIDDLSDDTVEKANKPLGEPKPAQPQSRCPLLPSISVGGAPQIQCVRLSRRAKELGDRAEKCVYRQLKAEQAAGRIAALRWPAREGQTPGWDIEYEELPTRVHRRIEVKGFLAKSVGAFELTGNELKAALKYRSEFGLAIVTESGSPQPRVFYLWDVARWFADNRLVREPLVWAVRAGPTPA